MSCLLIDIEKIAVVPLLRATTHVYAPPRTVAGLLRDSELATEAMNRAGVQVSTPARVLSVGDEVRFVVRAGFGLRMSVSTRMTRIDPGGLASELASGPLRALTHTTKLTSTDEGTLTTDELIWTGPFPLFGPVVDAVGRKIAHRVLAERAAVLVERASALDTQQVVVATALVRDRRLLVAQRTRPAEVAGQWELPGGRVESGESERDAVVRECHEELGIEVEVTGRLGTDLPIPTGVLRVYTAQLHAEAAEPQPREHAELRWVSADEVPGLDWVEADRGVVDDLVQLLRTTTTSD